MNDAGICRDKYIDFLRGLGFLLLIVAHTSSPNWLFNIRTFDVPLMVIISAACYKPLRGGYLAYFIKRLKRIYIPVFIFLSIYFSFRGILAFLGAPPISWEVILSSYMLLNGIGYVWIMRVFLLVALLLPAIDMFVHKINYLILIIAVFIVQQCLIELTPYNKTIETFYNEYILYAVGYTPFIIFGLSIRKISRLQMLLILTFLIVAMLGFMIYHHAIISPQMYKYPPQSLYILYGIFASGLLWTFRPLISDGYLYRIFNYLSTNSMWLYLWHIIGIPIAGTLKIYPNTWFLRFLIVLAVALILNFSYQKLIKYLPEKIYSLVK